MLRIGNTEAKADALISETSKSFEQARRYVDLTQFESEESSAAETIERLSWKVFSPTRRRSFASAKSLAQGDDRQNQTRTALLSENAAEFKD